MNLIGKFRKMRLFISKAVRIGGVLEGLNLSDDDLVLDKNRRNKMLASLDDSKDW
ncbi:MAG TPA: hypothetical protein VGN23_04055 [Verrucomicrobiae bacterium]|jgi:hypothetical protein